MKFNQIIASLFISLPILVCSQAELIFNGIQLNESLETVSKKVSTIAEAYKINSVETPIFPLAKTREDHLVCTNVSTKNGILDQTVFTFADDKLVYIEARGNVTEVFVTKRIDTARAYINYDVYFEDKLFIDKKNDIAWVLSEEATHVNLFSWENPYLDTARKSNSKANSRNEIPEFLKMGAAFNELKPHFDTHSKFTSRDELDGSDPNAQFQINCFGVDYLGFPRKMEARFGDNKLNVVWILTGKGEEDRIRKALIEQYGKPIFVNEDWEIFNNWQVGLRKDKPEILLIEQKLGLEYKTSYFKQ